MIVNAVYKFIIVNFNDLLILVNKKLTNFFSTPHPNHPLKGGGTTPTPNLALSIKLPQRHFYHLLKMPSLLKTISYRYLIIISYTTNLNKKLIFKKFFTTLHALIQLHRLVLSYTPNAKSQKIGTLKSNWHVRLFCLFLFCLTAGAIASDKINNIKILGNQRVESETILSYIPINKGDPVTEHELDSCLKSLFATGYFYNVKVDREGSTLLITVEENPIINQIAFEGNNKLKDEDIKKEVQLRPREVLSPMKVQAAQQRILEIYRRLGRFGAKVDPKIIKMPENRANLVFEIHEGSVTHVRKINFIGNKHFSDKKLKPHLLTKESKWYRFFANDDTYDPDRFLSDQQALSQFYYNSGYPDFRIVSAIAELSTDQKDFYLTFTVEEGALYHFGDVKIESAINSVKIEDLYKAVTFKKGEEFSSKSIDKTITEITKAVSSQGYAFVNVEQDIQKDRENKIANINFKIVEGPRVYVEKIEIIGNDRTRDYVIRREMCITEGDAYNSKYIKDSEKKIKQLNYFKEVSVETEEGSAPDKVKLIVHVEEQPTGELGASIGFSSLEGPIFNIHLQERNFRGAGQTLHSQLTISKNTQNINAGIIEPYFLDKELEGSADVYVNRSTLSKSYKETAYGTVFGVGYPLSEHWHQRLNYGINLDQVYGLASNVSPIISNQAKNAVKSWIGQTIAYNRLELEERETVGGYIWQYGTTFAGVGGSVRYLGHDLSTSYYWSLVEDVILKVYGSVAILQKVGKTIRVADSFRLGGETLRGFDYEGIGPRDGKYGNALGGTKMWRSTVELKFPVGLPTEWEIKGSTFIDAGSLWKPGQSDVNTLDKNSMRAAAGVGISWKSPFGPIAIYYGRMIKRQKFDHHRPVLVQFSTVF